MPLLAASEKGRRFHCPTRRGLCIDK